MKKNIIFKSDKNIIFERTDYVKRSKIRVYNQYLTMVTYRFNNVELNYDTKYMNWENQNCCGGWVYNEKYLHTAVQKDKKLYAGIYLNDDISELEETIRGQENYLNYGYENKSKNSNWYYICKKGCVSDYINIKNIIEQYKKLGLRFSLENEELLRQMCSEEIESFKNTDNIFDFDYANPGTVFGDFSFIGLIFNGMLLGYPIEATASILGL